MIAINVVMTSPNLVYEDNLDSKLNQHYVDIYTKFKDWVDRNIILNVCDDQTYADVQTTTYFAMSEENARIFQQEFSDYSSDFCVKKFWEDNGIEVSVSYVECTNFDNADAPFTVVGAPYVIWGYNFPVTEPDPVRVEG
jgi:hypothetical protein